MNKTLLLPLLFTCTTGFAVAAAGNDLTTNGGFEAGDTSGWTSFPSAGSSFNVTGDANSGSFGAELFNPTLASGAVVKQANIGIGAVQPGDTIRISFAAKGSFAAGGVAVAEFFSELDGGGTSANEILGGGPLPLDGDWQTFCFTTTAGPDVSGGVSLQFVAATGGAAGSTAVVFIDDASVQIDEMTTNGGFEQGDTSGWQSFPSMTSVFFAVTDPNSGTFGGFLGNDSPASGAIIKQANLAAGVVQPGDPIEISFAAKGTAALGGVAFAEFFSEVAGGGTSSNEILGGGPLPLTNMYQTFTFSTTAGPDVSGGITLQFGAITGATAGSLSVIILDDVTVRNGAGQILNYCVATPNSTGAGGVMSTTGSPSVANQDFGLQASGLPASTFALFFVGTASGSGPSFNGRQCITGNVCRIGPILFASPSGVVTRDMPDAAYTAFGCIPPAVGTTYFFQCVYRDSVGTGGNWTDALCVTFGN